MLKLVIRRIVIACSTFLFYLFRCFPVQTNKVVFSNFGGKGFGDNPKYVAKVLLNNPKISMYWLCDNPSESFPEGIIAIKRESLIAIYHLVTARVWVDNSRKPYYVRKRSNQYYIQTWHGGVSLKKFERDSEIPLSKEWTRASKRDSKMIDALIVNSEWGANYLKKSFWYDGEMFMYGSPRNDILVNRSFQTRHETLQNLSLPDEHHYALYAPTFRDDFTIDAYNIKPKELLQALEHRYSGKWTLLVRLHPILSEKNVDLKLLQQTGVVDVTHYPDMSELMNAAELLITDYSSCSLDDGFAGKRVVLFASDVSEYVASRGLNFELDKLPFPLTVSNSELFDTIRGFDDAIYQRKLDAFNQSLGVVEHGDASELVAKLVELKMVKG